MRSKRCRAVGEPSTDVSSEFIVTYIFPVVNRKNVSEESIRTKCKSGAGFLEEALAVADFCARFAPSLFGRSG
ncbi:MAG: hypothetical protein MSA49_02005 [Clostridia bacterium]|nr:hypothetical protein [Clostridia bacterium]